MIFSTTHSTTLEKASACRSNTQIDLSGEGSSYSFLLILCSLLGFVVAQSLPFWGVSYLSVIFLSSIFLVFASWKTQVGPSIPKITRLVVGIIMVSMGYFQGFHLVESNMSSCLRFIEVTNNFVVDNITGTITNLPQEAANGEVTIEIQADIGRLRLKVIEYPWTYSGKSARGTKVNLKGLRLKPILSDDRSLPNPLSYDGYLFREGFVGSGFVEKYEIITIGQVGLDQIILNRLVDKYGRSEALGVLLASTTANVGTLGYEIKKIFRETGTSHLLVISGLHISTIFFTCYCCCVFLIKRCRIILLLIPAQIPSLIIALSIAIAYALITGAQISTVRAMLMTIIFVIGQILGRYRHQMRSFVLVAFIIAVIWPGAVFDIGFELTFLAVFGLYAAQNYHIERFLVRDNTNHLKARLINIFVKVLSSLLYCVGAWLFTMPVTLYWFKSTTIASAIINVLVVAPFSFLTIIAGLPLLALDQLAVPGSTFAFNLLLWSLEKLLVFLNYLNILSSEMGIGYIKLDEPECPTLIVLSIIFALSFALIPMVLQKTSKILWQKNIKTYICAVQEQKEDMVFFSFNESPESLSRGK